MLTQEHIIPHSLGGRLVSRFLCSTCNKTLGYGLEHAARSDPSIRIAAQRLSPKIPNLARQLEENQRYLGESEAQLAPGYIRNGDFRVFARKLKDGSLIQPTDEARRSIQGILQKSGCDHPPIEDAVQTFDNAPDNEKVEVAPGLEIVKWRIDKIQPDFNKSPLMNPLVPLKIAYEFIACHLGIAIYEQVPPLDEIREALKNQEPDSESLRVERLHAKEYESFHGICFEGNNPHASVQIRLFGWLAFRVHFLRLAVNGRQFIYTHYLDSGNEDVRILRGEAET